MQWLFLPLSRLSPLPQGYSDVQRMAGRMRLESSAGDNGLFIFQLFAQRDGAHGSGQEPQASAKASIQDAHKGALSTTQSSLASTVDAACGPGVARLGMLGRLSDEALFHVFAAVEQIGDVEVIAKDGRTLECATLLLSDPTARLVPVTLWKNLARWTTSLEAGDIVEIRHIGFSVGRRTRRVHSTGLSVIHLLRRRNTVEGISERVNRLNEAESRLLAELARWSRDHLVLMHRSCRISGAVLSMWFDDDRHRWLAKVLSDGRLITIDMPSLSNYDVRRLLLTRVPLVTFESCIPSGSQFLCVGSIDMDGAADFSELWGYAAKVSDLQSLSRGSIKGLACIAGRISIDRPGKGRILLETGQLAVSIAPEVEQTLFICPDGPYKVACDRFIRKALSQSLFAIHLASSFQLDMHMLLKSSEFYVYKVFPLF